MYAFIFRTCLTYTLFVAVFAEIPSYIKICSRKNPDINNCILNSIEELREKLVTGISELDVPSIEPFELKQIQLSRGPQNAQFNVNFTNLQVYGASKFKINNFKADVENIIFTFNILIDQLNIKGKYQMDAKILLLKLVGDGNFTTTFNNYSCKCYMKANKVFKNNNTYINFEKMKFNINVGQITIQLDNLFNGDPVLGPVTNDILNANGELFLDEIKPVLTDTLADYFTKISNKITESFTYNELFPNK